ncbi:hypothetical protein ABPG75_010221 [Micractinium tetrahymenae]
MSGPQSRGGWPSAGAEGLAVLAAAAPMAGGAVAAALPAAGTSQQQLTQQTFGAAAAAHAAVIVISDSEDEDMEDDDIHILHCSVTPASGGGSARGSRSMAWQSSANASRGAAGMLPGCTDEDRGMQAALLASLQDCPAAAAAASSTCVPGSGAACARPSSSSLAAQRIGGHGCSTGGSASGAGTTGSRLSGAAMEWPMGLLECRGMCHAAPPTGRQDMLGVRMQDIVCHGQVPGGIQLAVICLFGLSIQALTDACPDLLTCGQLVLLSQAPLAELEKEAHLLSYNKRLPPLKILVPPLEQPTEKLQGKHHTKMFLLFYQTGVRVVVHSSNDFPVSHCIQGVWWQDFPRLGQPPASGLPESAFGRTLYKYIKACFAGRPADAAPCLKRIAQHDFSMARAALVASVPGRFQGAELHDWGHMALRAALAPERFPSVFRGSRVLSCSSGLTPVPTTFMDAMITSLTAGLCKDGATPLGRRCAHTPWEKYSVLWCSKQYVKSGNGGWCTGAPLSGTESAVKCPALNPHLCVFEGPERCGRQRCAPHLKVYCRPSLDGKRLGWATIGSHNLSRAAWGVLQNEGRELYLRSYEVSVLLLPSLEAAYRRSRWCGFSCTAGSSGGGAEGDGGGCSMAGIGGGMAGCMAGSGGVAGQGPLPLQEGDSVEFAPFQPGSFEAPCFVPAVGGGGGAARTLGLPLPIPFTLMPRPFQVGEEMYMWRYDYGEEQDWKGRTYQEAFDVRQEARDEALNALALQAGVTASLADLAGGQGDIWSNAEVQPALWASEAEAAEQWAAWDDEQMQAAQDASMAEAQAQHERYVEATLAASASVRAEPHPGGLEEAQVQAAMAASAREHQEQLTGSWDAMQLQAALADSWAGQAGRVAKRRRQGAEPELQPEQVEVIELL